MLISRTATHTYKHVLLALQAHAGVHNAHTDEREILKSISLSIKKRKLSTNEQQQQRRITTTALWVNYLRSSHQHSHVNLGSLFCFFEPRFLSFTFAMNKFTFDFVFQKSDVKCSR